MTDNRTSFRLEILNRLCKRERQQRCVKDMFKNYSLLDEQLQQSHRSRSVSVNDEHFKGNVNDRLAVMKEEMANVYRMKSKNDQDLIDANRKLADSESRYSLVSSQRDKLRIETDAIVKKMTVLEVKLFFTELYVP